jgi:hypothetical protein
MVFIEGSAPVPSEEVIGEDANTVGRLTRADVFTAEYCIPYAADSDFSGRARHAAA